MRNPRDHPQANGGAVIGVGQQTWVGSCPDDGRHWTKVACTGCDRTGWVLTHELPLTAALTPVRDDDGCRIGLCAGCARPNRAQRRQRR